MGAQELNMQETRGREACQKVVTVTTIRIKRQMGEHMKENLSALVTDQKQAPVVGKGEDNVITWETGRTTEIDQKSREELALDTRDVAWISAGSLNL